MYLSPDFPLFLIKMSNEQKCKESPARGNVIRRGNAKVKFGFRNELKHGALPARSEVIRRGFAKVKFGLRNELK